jgi:hypothetical protein
MAGTFTPEAVARANRARRDHHLPAGPLLDWWRAHPEVTEGWGNQPADALPRGPDDGAHVRRRLGELERQKLGRVPLLTADWLCCRLGVHPLEIWGDDYWRGKLS